MFWSKIWIFLFAVAAGGGLALALIMAKPGERATINNEKVQLTQACSIANILFKDNARQRVQLAGEYARIAAPGPSLNLGAILVAASKGELVSAANNSTGRQALNKIFQTDDEAKKKKFPAFLTLLDRSGRVVARWSKDGKGDDKFGESMRGYHLVDEALAGYMLDDLWVIEGTLYRVSGSPVVYNGEWAGAVVLGFKNDADFAAGLAKELSVNVNFYLGDEALAASTPVQIHKEVGAKSAALKDIEQGKDCATFPAFTVTSGEKSFSVVLSRLPGEAGAVGAYFAVFAPQSKSHGFMGTFGKLTKDDLSFSSFPWILVALVFLLMVGIGMFVLIMEIDRPMRRLGNEAVLLAKAEIERLNEGQHKGKFGSIARSVNVALDKSKREAKNAQQNLDQLLGPAPGGEVMSQPTPAVGFAPPPPPPPSQFQFSHSGSMVPQPMPGSPRPATPVPAPPPMMPSGGLDMDIPPAPPPMDTQMPTQLQTPPRPVGLPGAPEERTPPPVPVRAPTPRPAVVSAIDEEILAPAPQAPSMPDMPDEMPTIISDRLQNLAEKDSESQYFRQVFDEFITTKQNCGEDASKLTFEKFAAKLRKNRDALIQKHNCRSVRFQVYVKNGKAALKASPVRT